MCVSVFEWMSTWGSDGVVHNARDPDHVRDVARVVHAWVAVCRRDAQRRCYILHTMAYHTSTHVQINVWAIAGIMVMYVVHM